MPTYSRSPAQREAASLLKRLVAAPYPQPAPAEEPEPLTLWQRIGLERVLYAVLALALLLGSLFPGIIGSTGLQTITPNEGNIGALAAAVDNLSDDDVVLLAYEWDAQRISELEPLENAITQHLIEQNVGIISVSTDPQGTLLSFELRDALQAAGYQGRGFDYILLGYRPGGEIALRSMAQDFRATLRSDFKNEDATVGALVMDMESGEPRLETLADLSMIVVMADQAQDVQSWMEQVHRVVRDVPMVMLLPAEVAPVAQPYLRQPGIASLVGKRDALTYNEVRQGTASASAQAVQDDGKLAFAVLIFVVLLVVGLVVRAIARRSVGK
jgi:hypothetical protein